MRSFFRVSTMRYNRKHPGDCFIAQLDLIVWDRFLGLNFDLSGIYPLKSRSRREFEGIYTSAYPRSPLGLRLVYLRCFGLARVKYCQVLKNLFTWKRQRHTLATPLPSTTRLLQPSLTASLTTKASIMALTVIPAYNA
jgi:hypothetical protein